MNFDFVNFYARVLIINLLALLFLIFSFYESVGNGEIPALMMTLVVIHNVIAFLYPVSILFRRAREKSYFFLKSWWHYVAVPLMLLYWIVLFAY